MPKRIAYIQYTNPAAYPPLEHSSRILAEADWRVLFLGIRMETVAALEFPSHPNIIVRQLAVCHRGWRQKLHYATFTLWAILRTIVWRASWVYASDKFAAAPALALSYLPGIRVLYHEHDSPSDCRNGHGAELSWFMRFVLWARRKLARRAAHCVLPNAKRLERFQRDTGRSGRATCVWNCPARNEAQELKPPNGGNSIALVYHGSLVPARIPPTLIQALSFCPGARLRIIGYETDGGNRYTAELQKIAHTVSVANRVEFIAAVPRRDSLAYCRAADVGVAFMPRKSADFNEQAMAGASNKPFDYLACGLALLLSDLPEWRKLYVDTGYGIAVDPDDPHSIADALIWYQQHPAERRDMGERGRQRILADWNYETQFAPVLEHLSSSHPVGSVQPAGARSTVNTIARPGSASFTSPR